MTPPRIALGSLAILASSPFFVYYGQQARPYALIELLATANMLAFVKVLEAPEERRWMSLWAASCVVLLYSQYLGGVLIALEMAIAVVRLRVGRLKVVLYGLAAIALIGPCFIAAMYGPISKGADPLGRISWMSQPKPVDFVWFYVSVFGTIPGIRSRWLLGAVACAGTCYLYKSLRAGVLGLKESFLLAVAFGIPSLVYALSTCGPTPIFEGRQMIAAAIAFVGAIGLLASSLKRGLDVAFLVMLVAWTAAAMPQAFPQTSKPAWRQVASDLNDRYGTEAVVVLEGWVGKPLQFYRGGNRVRMWDGLNDDEKGKRFLLLCRPFLDSRPGLEDSRCQRVLVASWRRRRSIQPGFYSELNLYEVVPKMQVLPP